MEWPINYGVLKRNYTISAGYIRIWNKKIPPNNKTRLSIKSRGI
jgi:hypothetical protein